MRTITEDDIKILENYEISIDEQKNSIKKTLYNIILTYNCSLLFDKIVISSCPIYNVIIVTVNDTILEYTFHIDYSGIINAIIECVVINKSDILKQSNLMRYPMETPYGILSNHENRDNENNENNETNNSIATFNNMHVRVIYLPIGMKLSQSYQPFRERDIKRTNYYCNYCSCCVDRYDCCDRFKDSYMRIQQHDRNGMIAFIANRYWFGMNICPAFFDPVNKIIYCGNTWNFDSPEGITMRNNNDNNVEIFLAHNSTITKNKKLLYTNNILDEKYYTESDSYWHTINTTSFFKKLSKWIDLIAQIETNEFENFAEKIKSMQQNINTLVKEHKYKEVDSLSELYEKYDFKEFLSQHAKK